MADFLDEKRREIKARLDELRPLVDEYHRLDAALRALDGVPATPAPTTTSARSGGRRPTSTPRANNGSGQRGRPRGTGTRAKETLELVRSQPGISIPEMAQKMGIRQNYLYRVLPALQKDGLVRKEGRGWHVVSAA